MRSSRRRAVSDEETQCSDDEECVAEPKTFEYESFFAGEIEKKKMDHSYRVFKKVMRDAAKFPAAKEFSRMPKVTTKH